MTRPPLGLVQPAARWREHAEGYARGGGTRGRVLGPGAAGGVRVKVTERLQGVEREHLTEWSGVLWVECAT
jgi:hypothetical protein